MKTVCQLLGTPQCNDGTCHQCRLTRDLAVPPSLRAQNKALRDALEAMYRMHVRDSGHTNGECANCFVAAQVLAENTTP